MEFVTIRFRYEEAEQLGLFVCGNCGLSKNNHAFKPSSCKGYKEVSRCGKIIKRTKNSHICSNYWGDK